MSTTAERPWRALLATSDRRGITHFGGALAGHGWELVATSGTASALREAGLAVVDVADVAGLPTLLGGRVKTFTVNIFGAILMRPGSAEDRADAVRWSIGRFHLVLCGFYPFDAIGPDDDRIDRIDVGGPAMLRAAAKNHEHVIPVADCDDYGLIVDALSHSDGDPSGVGLELRRQLAAKVFSTTAAYDSHIAAWMQSTQDP